MNYEQKYKESLERAKEQLNGAKAFDYDNEQIAHDIRSVVYNIFPELKESENEKLRKEMLQIAKESEDSFYMILTPNKRETLIAWLEKQGGQKSVDKVEPKFHEGDFIKHNKANLICKVISVNSGSYYVENIETSCRAELFYAEQSFHLWTIEDAKDGDVLAGKIDGDSYILIYKQIKDGWIETYGHYYDSVDRFCVPSQLFCREVKGTFCLATKEQRDTLFARMREAGYKWDKDKKELIKL